MSSHDVRGELVMIEHAYREGWLNDDAELAAEIEERLRVLKLNTRSRQFLEPRIYRTGTSSLKIADSDSIGIQDGCS